MGATTAFKTLLFQLDNGEKQIVNHPEIIVTAMMIVVDNKGRLIYIAPEVVSTGRYAPASKRNARHDNKSAKPKC